MKAGFFIPVNCSETHSLSLEIDQNGAVIKSRVHFLSADPFSAKRKKKKTNLSLVPAGLTLRETKQVLCQFLQQHREARLATSPVGRDGFHNRLWHLSPCYRLKISGKGRAV